MGNSGTSPEQTDLEPLVTIEGVVERVVYENAENGFFVARLKQEGRPDLLTFVGTFLAVSPGETVRLTGRWVDEKRFGRQLRVESFQTVLPATVQGIEKYLGSGLVEGVGPVYAKRLVETFGVETLRVIDEEPARLQRVPGIGPKRAAQIREAWARQKSVQSIMIFLQGHGIGTALAAKIYKRYGDGAVAVLRENPYRLAQDISGVAFRTADKIARELGIAPEAPQRIQAGLLHVLDEAANDGHVCLKRENLLKDGAELLQVPETAIESPFQALVLENRMVAEDDWTFAVRWHAAESGCAERLKRLAAARDDLPPIKNVDNALRYAERAQSIELSPEQRDAVRIGLSAKVMVITGGPGTGKTTVIKSILAINEKKSVVCLLAAPTGRAAKRMEEATGRPARTIHRLLEYSPQNGGFTRNEYNPLHVELLVIDEASMIDIALMHHLLKALPSYARLILVGDIDQLPSVGPGSVLLDIIASNCFPTVRLHTVFRQAAESGIIANAHRINTGQQPLFNTKDFFLIQRSDPAQALETVVEVVQRRLPRSFGFDPARDIQVLAPMHRGDAGVTRLNEALQQALNPNGAPVPRRNFRAGDKVMQLRNNYELEVFNGDVGVITDVREDERALGVSFDNHEVLYDFDDLDDLGLAYAATVHKSQGSEYPAVVLALLPQHYMMLQRNVLYTAITRARRVVVIVGTPKAIATAVRNNMITRRNTRLTERLRNTL
ncbi:MAG: ATP-dependent RecD-like DNA helicase [Candidatus Hydrogenedentes bacterium]|nr:ATP-dependent RecD-like DNA helicase [Candidatus Hydrogenedentota bacterium]